ncbi:MAG: membrane protein insertion efficiency factor YidD [Sediminibacterium sp.]|jgi:putative membrane protein insertion efficiency factor
MELLKKIMAFPFVVLIKFYQYVLSPYLGGSKCRYTPSCSQYTMDAIKKYGPIKGIFLGAKRLSRCHPGGGHGYDPVP